MEPGRYVQPGNRSQRTHGDNLPVEAGCPSPYLTHLVRVLFPPGIDALSICASCCDENELEDRCVVHGDVSFEARMFAASRVLAFALAQQQPIMDKLAAKIIAKYQGTHVSIA
jgi:hypothetical protein